MYKILSLLLVRTCEAFNSIVQHSYIVSIFDWTKSCLKNNHVNVMILWVVNSHVLNASREQ